MVLSWERISDDPNEELIVWEAHFTERDTP